MKTYDLAGKIFVLVAALLINFVSASGQPVSESPARIPASELQADFAILKRAYEEMHPGLYRYNSQAQMEANFAALAAELNQDLTLQQAYLAFSIFLAKIKCGHSYPNFYNQPKAVAETLFKPPGRVPFYFRWLNRRMIVTRNFSTDKNLLPGTEVVAINGVPVKKILARLMTIARADGSNDAKRISYLEVSGESNYEAFDIYFQMFFPSPGNTMELEIRQPPASKKMVLSVPALTYEQRVAPIKTEIEARRGGDAPLWDFKYPDERTAYLRMPTWAVFNSKWDWKAFLEKFFDGLAGKKTANLVIDLRGNEGGAGVGDVILSRLIKQDLRLEQFKRMVRYRSAPADLAPYLDTWDRSFADWGAAATDFKDGFYTLKRDNDAKGDIIKASARPFEGRTFVLVDSSNSSATFEFAQAVQQNRLATLVGQPTGGNQRGINGGAFFFLRLPHTKIEIDLPLIGFYPTGVRPDAGLQPDIPVEPRVEDIAGGVDAELNALRPHLLEAKKPFNSDRGKARRR